MNSNALPKVVGLGPVSSEIVAPVLGDQLIYIENPTSDDLLVAQGAIVRAAFKFDKSVFDSMPNLKVIARTGVGTELVDLDAASERGIPVVTTPGSNSMAVAEGAFAHILHLTKRLGPLTKLVANGNWNERTSYPVGDLAEQTLGIIGYGRIGVRVSAIATSFGMKVIAFDPYANIVPEIKASSLTDLLSKANVITLHLPLSEETRGMIGEEQISQMKDGVILVNCSRGALIDLDAAFAALVSGKIGGVGLDVFDPEPPEHHVLFDHENVVLTPHVMGLSKQATFATLTMAAQGVRDLLTLNIEKSFEAIPNPKNIKIQNDRSNK
jgi:D-3-phosphoglycerate dehydrogenase / 2-oxoglutarate reductase